MSEAPPKPWERNGRKTAPAPPPPVVAPAPATPAATPPTVGAGAGAPVPAGTVPGAAGAGIGAAAAATPGLGTDLDAAGLNSGLNNSTLTPSSSSYNRYGMGGVGGYGSSMYGGSMYGGYGGMGSMYGGSMYGGMRGGMYGQPGMQPDNSFFIPKQYAEQQATQNGPGHIVEVRELHTSVLESLHEYGNGAYARILSLAKGIQSVGLAATQAPPRQRKRRTQAAYALALAGVVCALLALLGMRKQAKEMAKHRRLVYWDTLFLPPPGPTAAY